jgi:hypothetical protein
MQTHLLNAPPDVVAADLGEDAAAGTLEDVLNRMAASRKIRVQILKAVTEEDEAQVEMRLLASRDSLSPVERAVVDALFGDSTVTTTATVERRYRKDGFDGDDLVADVNRRSKAAANKKQSNWHPVGSTVALILGLTGFALLIVDLIVTDRPPLVLFACIVAIAVIGGTWSSRYPAKLDRSRVADALLAVPLLLLIAAVAAIHILFNETVGMYAAAGITLFALGRFQSILNGKRRVIVGDRQRLADLAQARAYAARELRTGGPRLEDGWIPHLEALGLRDAIETWRDRAEKQRGMTAGLARIDAASPRFTGRAPSVTSLPQGWSNGFWIVEEDGTDEEDEDRGESLT